MADYPVWSDSVDLRWADDVIRSMEHMALVECQSKGLVYTKTTQHYFMQEDYLHVTWTIDA